jgi:hypothetical protein
MLAYSKFTGCHARWHRVIVGETEGTPSWQESAGDQRN